MLRHLFIILLLASLTACGMSKNFNVREMSNPKSAMIYGYIHAKNTPMYFHWVQLRRINKAGKVDYYTTRSNEDGLFYAENLPFGKYEIHRIGQGVKPLGSKGNFGGMTAGGRQGVIWNMGDRSKHTAKRVKDSGVHYFGSFQYVHIKNKKFFGRDAFDFKRASKPSESDLLPHLIKYTKGTRWEEKINRRIAKLQ